MTLAASVVIAADRMPELEHVVASERAFAARAQQVNARQAFAEFFAPDSVLFSPFAAPAFPRLRERADWSVNIQWRPVAAAISGAGDMGYTTGPSEYRRTPGEPPIGYGHYTSVWQKQADGRYRVRIDIGIEHPAPAMPAPDWTRPADLPPPAAPLQEGARKAAARTLRDVDAQLGGMRPGVDSLAPLLAEDVRWHRGGQLPVTGRRAVLEAVGRSTEAIGWSPEATVIADSGDFGFTYGRGRWQRGNDTGELAYLNVWQRRDGDWRLLVHVSNAVSASR